MPSFVRHSRSYSYPPCIDSIDFAPHEEAELPDIDEDPFAHFLTPITEEDDPFDALSLSAGIIVHDGPRTSKATKFKSTIADKWARYVKNSQPELHNIYHDKFDDEDDETFMSLDDQRLIDKPHTHDQLSGPPTPKITVTEPTRGRAQVLVPGNQRRRRYSRTLSGHRHAWREPSPGLFTVMESEEAESSTLKGTTKDGEQSRRSRVEVVEKSKL